MGLDDCIKKINDDKGLPSFSPEEIEELQSLRGDTEGVDPDVADLRAARAYGKQVNDSLNKIKEVVGIDPVEVVDDELVEPEIQEITPEAEPEIESEITESTGVPTQPEKVDIEVGGLNKFDTMAKNIQDQSIKLKRVQQQVEKETGKEVFGTELDAYNSLDLEKNIASAESKKILNDAVQAPDSFVNRARKEGVSFNTDDKINFGKYLHAKHAQERNARIKEIGDEKITELTEKIDRIYN
jgi:hypothetical protein